MSSGSEPSSGTPYCAAMRSPPPAPKTCSAWPQLRAHVHGHVLDDAQHRHLDLLEHPQRLARVEQRDVLRRGDDDRRRHRHALRQRELDVAGARRQVDDQVVQVLPQRGGQQLLQVLRGHRAAPDRRRVLAEEQADRHRLQAVRRAWARCACRPGSPGLPLQAEHHRDAGAVDVGVEHADAARPRPPAPAPG